MKRTTLIALVAGLAMTIGCVAEEEAGDSLDLTNSLSDGKADSIAGKRIEPVFTGTERLDPSVPYDGEVEVETIGSAILEIRGPRLIVEAGKNRRMRFQVEKRGFDMFTELRFVVGLREAGTGSDWTMVELEGTVTSIFGGTREITINYFDFLQLDPYREELTFEYLGDAFTRPFSGARDVDLEWTIMVFPESGWGSLDGTYAYTLSME